LFRGTTQRRKSQEGEWRKSSSRGILEFLVKTGEFEIHSKEEKNDSRPLDMVKLHRR